MKQFSAYVVVIGSTISGISCTGLPPAEDDFVQQQYRAAAVKPFCAAAINGRTPEDANSNTTWRVVSGALTARDATVTVDGTTILLSDSVIEGTRIRFATPPSPEAIVCVFEAAQPVLRVIPEKRRPTLVVYPRESNEKSGFQGKVLSVAIPDGIGDTAALQLEFSATHESSHAWFHHKLLTDRAFANAAMDLAIPIWARWAAPNLPALRPAWTFDDVRAQFPNLVRGLPGRGISWPTTAVQRRLMLRQLMMSISQSPSTYDELFERFVAPAMIDNMLDSPKAAVPFLRTQLTSYYPNLGAREATVSTVLAVLWQLDPPAVTLPPEYSIAERYVVDHHRLVLAWMYHKGVFAPYWSMLDLEEERPVEYRNLNWNFLDIFDESATNPNTQPYISIERSYGHPYDNLHELMASTTTVLKMFPQEFMNRYAQLNTNEQNIARPWAAFVRENVPGGFDQSLSGL